MDSFYVFEVGVRNTTQGWDSTSMWTPNQSRVREWRVLTRDLTPESGIAAGDHRIR